MIHTLEGLRIPTNNAHPGSRQALQAVRAISLTAIKVTTNHGRARPRVAQIVIVCVGGYSQLIFLRRFFGLFGWFGWLVFVVVVVLLLYFASGFVFDLRGRI